MIGLMLIILIGLFIYGVCKNIDINNDIQNLEYEEENAKHSGYDMLVDNEITNFFD